MTKILLLLVLTIFPGFLHAGNSQKSWYNRDWNGWETVNPRSVSCGMALDSEKSTLMFYFTQGDPLNTGKTTADLWVTLTNVGISMPGEYYEVGLKFDNQPTFKTIARASILDNEIVFFETKVRQGSEPQIFAGDGMSYQNFVLNAKSASRLRIYNDNDQLVANVSLMGFTNVFSKWANCVSRRSG